MQYTTLGSTDIRIPEVGLGTWEYRGGVEPLRRGLDLGATLIDTAEVYGTEGIVGEAIKGRRKDVFLATKVSGDHLRHKDVLRAADASLRKLGTDWIDLYQIHWPDSSVPIEETMRAMEELVEAGKVRHIGVSNFSADEQRKAQAALRKHHIVSNQPLYNLIDREIERDLLRYCQREKVTVLAYSPLARGALISSARLGDRKCTETIERIVRETGKTKVQVVLNWCLSRPGVIVIPKSDRVERVKENCGASGWRLKPEQVRALDQAFA